MRCICSFGYDTCCTVAPPQWPSEPYRNPHRCAARSAARSGERLARRAVDEHVALTGRRELGHALESEFLGVRQVGGADLVQQNIAGWRTANGGEHDARPLAAVRLQN